MNIFVQISDSVLHGDFNKCQSLVSSALEQGNSARSILDKGLFSGMSKVGDLFKKEEVFVPEVIMAARAMQCGMNILTPHLVKNETKESHKIILGTVKGDIHDLGKHLVGVMLKGAGFEVIDLGVDVSADKFIAAAVKEKASVIGMSALLTTTMAQMKTVVEALDQAGLKGKVKTLIGGACVSQRFADCIGADAYAENSATAVDKMKELLGLA
jgi:5-methyltetrahydrofolate--homocysteine methyltransferase